MDIRDNVPQSKYWGETCPPCPMWIDAPDGTGFW